MIVVIVLGSVEPDYGVSLAPPYWNGNKQLLDGSFSFDFTRCTVSAHRNPSNYASFERCQAEIIARNGSTK